jgi:hypothetical protein
MPGRLILEIASTQISIPIKGTAAQIRAAVRRYALSKNMAVDAMTDTQIGEAVLRALLKIVRDGSIDRQRAEANQAQQAALEATLAADNDLYDEPPL